MSQPFFESKNFLLLLLVLSGLIWSKLNFLERMAKRTRSPCTALLASAVLPSWSLSLLSKGVWNRSTLSTSSGSEDAELSTLSSSSGSRATNVAEPEVAASSLNTLCSRGPKNRFKHEIRPGALCTCKQFSKSKLVACSIVIEFWRPLSADWPLDFSKLQM